MSTTSTTVFGPVTDSLSRFAATCRWEHIAPEVRHEAKRSLLNFFAVALAACQDPTIEKAVGIYRRFSAGNAATLIGRGERVDILNAAALNAMSANVFDFDDTHIPTIIHPTAPIAPALLALAETRPVTGPELMLAFVLGVEVECRLGNAISPGHYSRGWHITSTCGVFGSAIATGKILGLQARQFAWALGSASSQAGGLVETLGTMAKSVGVGNAARNGLLSALLAQADFDGPAQPLEGVRGFLNVVGDNPDIASSIRDLGARWEILHNTYKPYPCGVVLNPVIDACLAVSGRPELAGAGVDDIEVIEIVGHPLLRQRTDRPGIQTGRQSQVSAQHAVAVTLTRGKAGLEDFSDAAVEDPALRALGAKVRFVDDNRMSVESARVVIGIRGAPAVSSSVDIARGALARPLTDADLEAKLRELCRYGRSGRDPEALISAIWRLEELNDAGALMRLVARLDGGAN
jgi:2-methylcitrate dehydratase PrpD